MPDEMSLRTYYLKSSWLRIFDFENTSFRIEIVSNLGR